MKKALIHAQRSGTEELLPGLWRFSDTCNVYVVQRERGAIAIDFGSGNWLETYRHMDLNPISRVYLTHHHPEVCAGLSRRKRWPFEVHAPVGEDRFLSLEGVSSFRSQRLGPVPASYSVLPKGLRCDVKYDARGFADHAWEGTRIRFIHTPGHGPNALSILVDHAGKQVLFCGDAARAGAVIERPYHLEWDHWTGNGASAAADGIERIASLRVDLLCPAQGHVVRQNPRAELSRLARKLRRFVTIKGSICAGEPDRYVPEQVIAPGIRKLLPMLYGFGSNGYLLVSEHGEALVVDPYSGDIPALESLLATLAGVRLTALVATHYHADHIDGAPELCERYGAELWLHPRVRAILEDRRRVVPFRPTKQIKARCSLLENGAWSWNEHVFRVAPFAGQTWWHCCLMTDVCGQKVLFAGDNFQPASRWNGTGGFSSINGSRFREGFAVSARLVLDWRPDILACGHGTCFRFAPTYFRKVLRWAAGAENATAALCVDGNLQKHYVLHDRVAPLGERSRVKRRRTPG
jgi:glyoxylase-like metal-dependent hydrolase (beta-lactamase superfamily II)